MKARSDFDIDKLRSVLDYDQYNGKITWKISTGKASAGAEAGSVGLKGYLKITYQGRTYAAHRLAWAIHHGTAPPEIIDHMNGDTLDNRASNLRDGTSGVNQQNQSHSHSRNQSSSYLGVSMFNGRWRAKIYTAGKYVFLGYHPTEEDAAEAYRQAKRKIHEGCLI
jgi:hypothetical protein